ncbi:acetyl-CoA carboxylase biotin carboxyl carrier protein subunit [Candidatus Bathyarchaeota archaeon]|nr:acetyl-CoA carboxylase biotin carboxyl carrier protein subunit [Candidatus Bathyarchaeota archaeon]
MSVAEGSSVSEGQTIVVLQSMKTEIHVVAEVHGRVRKLHVKEGQEVNLGQPVADLEPQ